MRYIFIAPCKELFFVQNLEEDFIKHGLIENSD
jgi:hypothetical protein